jgi:hypothetical protein
VQVAYAIGKAHPVGVFVETFGTGVIPDERIQAAVLDVFDLRPAAIIRDLDLLRPIYRTTSAYGHFGRPGLSWGAPTAPARARPPPDPPYTGWASAALMTADASSICAWRDPTASPSPRSAPTRA